MSFLTEIIHGILAFSKDANLFLGGIYMTDNNTKITPAARRLIFNDRVYGTILSPGVAQFAFGFYSVMLTSTILGILTMILFKPRSWCVYCPMGTMTQLICKIKAR